MTQSTFRAPRFFRSLDVPPASGDGGFLPDVDTDIGRAFAKESRRIEELLKYPCLVILGEPGIGKSTVMEERKKGLPPEAEFYDLRFAPATAVLGSEGLRRWQIGDGPFHLVIDSLDESPDAHFANHLVGALRKGPPQALRLELACRAGEWPPILRQRLPEIFDGHRIGYFQVEPLRRRDVIEICKARRLDPGRFLDLVSERDLQPLARIPLTLELLLDVFEQNQALPRRLRELYEQASLLLCEERSASRQSVGTTGMLSPRERLEVAAVLAAASVFSRCPVVCLETPGAPDVGLLSIDELLATTAPLPVSLAAVREVLRTGLFTSRGPGRWGWSHQSFAEYLAARWACSGGLTPGQTRQLLLHHEKVDTVVPQLVGVAAWLACFSPDIVALLAEHAPEYFIVADSELATEEHRARATEELLKRAENLTLRRRWANGTEYRRLGHPSLASQLAPFITSGSFNPLTRRVALDVAAANQLPALFDTLCGVALDRSIAAGIRADAVEAAIAAGSELPMAEVLARLRPLAEPGDASDPNEDIRAAVLEWLWPQHLAAVDLFRLLTLPERSQYFGRYEMFVSRLGATLKPEHLVDALKWVERNARRHGSDDCFAFEQPSGEICRLAAAHLQVPGVLAALAAAVHRRLSVYRSAFVVDDNNPWVLEADAREALVRAIVGRAEATPGDATLLIHPYGQAPLVEEGDIQWVIEAWRSSVAPQKDVWAALIKGLVAFRTRVESLEAVLQVVGDERVSDLLPMPRWIDPESDEARVARDNEARSLQWQDEHEQRIAKARERNAVDIKASVERALNGDLNAWQTLVLRLWDRPPRRSANLAEAVGELSEQDRSRMILAGRAFLFARDAEASRWLHDDDLVFYQAVAGYLTLRILAGHDCEWWRENRRALAGRWAGAVIGFSPHWLNDDQDRDGHARAIAEVFEDAPGPARAALEMVLRRPYRAAFSLPVLRYLPAHTEVTHAIRERLANPRLESQALGELLECLLRLELSAGLVVSAKLLSRRPARYAQVDARRGRVRSRPRSAHALRRRARERAMEHKEETCVRLLEEGSNQAVNVVCGFTARDPRLATRVWSRFPDRHLRAPWGGSVDSDVLGGLYAWLQKNLILPTHNDGDDAFFDDQLQFRLRLLEELSTRGTQESVAALRRLLIVFPGDVNLRFRCAEAEERYFENSWRPVAPRELLELARSANRRVVQSSPHLLECVLDAPKKYEAELHAETPAVMDLWSYKTTSQIKVYWPKDENDLSDHLKRFLKRELTDVLVNREVEIRPTEGARAGQRTDLLIQAKSAGTPERAEVVIEVKGSWNADLESDLEQQLVERYLTGGTLRCGVYVIGWFASTSWDATEQRRQATARRDKAAVENFLVTRAKELSIGGRLVAVRVLNTGFD